MNKIEFINKQIR